MFADALLDLDAPVSLEETPLARDSAWHGQLQLLASLPHSLMTLAPALTTAVRAGLRADFATIGLCHGTPTRWAARWGRSRVTRKAFIPRSASARAMS